MPDGSAHRPSTPSRARRRRHPRSLQGRAYARCRCGRRPLSARRSGSPSSSAPSHLSPGGNAIPACRRTVWRSSSARPRTASWCRAFRVAGFRWVSYQASTFKIDTLMAPIVEVDRLSKSFGHLRALNEISLSVAEGEVFGFLGPNGAGKTTTIRILLGLQRADGGTAKVGGFDCWTAHAKAAQLLGATLEQPALYGFLSGRDNLRLFARLLGPVDENQVSELLDLVGMKERGDDKVKRYSMGMRQRLALAQAMLGKPKLLILDEPTNGLDPNGIHGLRILLRKLADDGMTIFLSSHLLSEVEELCDRVVVLHRGEVKAAGPLSELMNVKGFHYRIDVSDADKAMEIVRSIDGATVEPGTIKDSIVVSSQTDLARTINRALVVAGIGVDQLVRTQRGLEDVYIELTGVAPGSPLSGPPPPPPPPPPPAPPPSIPSGALTP